MTIASALTLHRLNHICNMVNSANGNKIRTADFNIELEAHMGEDTDIERP